MGKRHALVGQTAQPVPEREHGSRIEGLGVLEHHAAALE
jgi:hypothetical protein